MKLAGALVLLGAALLLTSGGDCGICPAIKEKARLFFLEDEKAYLDYVEKYQDSTLVLKNAQKIKKCVDNTFSAEDKQNAFQFIEKIEASSIC
ncbi:major allergen I polypeptide chain 1-like [Arvicanthis niloticus]|uniref:major allergen I polypeptide chain 1-like n=1 Tax=Arvicanthis niloticus TaxID=61156 RepID=UPI0014873C5E|nr:major allergen I polypeptide chain 1-like [Arvicanthis niloticus]